RLSNSWTNRPGMNAEPSQRGSFPAAMAPWLVRCPWLRNRSLFEHFLAGRDHLRFALVLGLVLLDRGDLLFAATDPGDQRQRRHRQQNQHRNRSSHIKLPEVHTHPLAAATVPVSRGSDRERLPRPACPGRSP